jgi:transcription termination factor Rho
MPVLERNELEQSPLADLHAIASELGIEGYRRLRRDDLIEAILSGETPVSEPKRSDKDSDDADSDRPARRRSSRGGRGRRGGEEDKGGGDRESRGSSGGGGRGGRGRGKKDDDEKGGGGREREERDRDDDEPEVEGEPRTGVLDILPNGSGFVRVDPSGQSRDDVYVSPAQIRRCELRAGDEVAGPVRPPRRNERHPSLVRVETVNSAPAEPPEKRPQFSDLTPVFPSERLPAPAALDAAPIGKGSRVAIGGPPGAGATRLLREITDALEGNLDVLVVLAGVRPEEVTEWRRIDKLNVAGGGFDRAPDELAQIAEMAVERAKRIAEQGGDAVVIVDGLDALAPPAARRVFGAARNTEEAGSLTLVAATGSAGELQRLATTRVVLTADGTLDASASGTLRGELLGG